MSMSSSALFLRVLTRSGLEIDYKFPVTFNNAIKLHLIDNFRGFGIGIEILTVAIKILNFLDFLFLGFEIRGRDLRLNFHTKKLV